MRKYLSKDVVIVSLFVIAVVAVSVFALIRQNNTDQLLTAQVVNLLNIEQDGGFFYQNVEAKLENRDAYINVRIQLKDLKLEEIRAGDSIYVQKSVSSIGDTYVFSGHKRSTVLVWVIVIFFTLVLVVSGLQGLKFIFATVLMLMLLISGELSILLASANIYAVSLAVLGVISFASILVQVRKVKIALVMTISQLLTLFLILMTNLILFKVTFLTELFYTNTNFLESSISLSDFWAIMNTAVLFVSFGATINTTLDVAHSIMNKKKKYPTVSTINLIREGTSHHQFAIARVINTLFFVFIGITLVNILVSTQHHFLSFFDDPYVVQGILLFISAALSALLVGPITAVIMAMALNANEEKLIQFRLRPEQ